MPKKIDLTGRRFGRLVVLYETSERKGGNIVWHCRCDCGNEVDVGGHNLTSSRTTSCGCFQREYAAEAHTVHGMRRQGETHPVYRTWYHMLQRCENPNSIGYQNYGGRGITVCGEWHDAEKFIGWAVLNGWRKGLTLDRIDNDGNYEPSNCRWATRKEQAQNKRNNRFITFNGKTQTLAGWAEEIDISPNTLQYRVLHWPIERALTESVRKRAVGEFRE